MRRYGYDEHAATIAFAILEAAEYFLGRLPETFAGYEGADGVSGGVPNCLHPQAWATAAPLLLLRVLLGLDARSAATEQHAVLPERIHELALHHLPGPAGSYDASAARPAAIPVGNRRDGSVDPR
jgi:glycogen debranching enzyme